MYALFKRPQFRVSVGDQVFVSRHSGIRCSPEDKEITFQINAGAWHPIHCKVKNIEHSSFGPEVNLEVIVSDDDIPKIRSYFERSHEWRLEQILESVA